ncbi:hypothetical protein DV736_g52, partial [Chaetothyriales sp. CBS 134916]
MVQAPMLSAPLKQTNEIDWVGPLKNYIRTTYGDDPDKYSEECATLNRLRQDMRGAGADSASGRDLLYRYYGQLELLDLRFPIDENHIKISFTWFDAFTHKPTSQYSLAFEKASVIFNISAVLACHAAAQNRADDTGLKTAYHSFQASAGMFTYINENFLHAPSQDLNRDTVKTLTNINLAQGQETFLEKQVRDGKKPALLAKLSSQAHYLYSQAKEGLDAETAKPIFEPSWLKFIQIKALHFNSLAEFYQATAETEANLHGSATARLQVADKTAKQALVLAKAFPASPPSTSGLGSDTSTSLQAIAKRHAEMVQERLAESAKDNDFIYHQTVPAEASLQPVTKMPAAKAIPVSELYQGQDIQRIIGPDIFQKIVPLSVTESASMYDEEKAKLIRSEAEKVEQANGEMAASLDYLKLPSSLNVLKGGMDQEMGTDPEFDRWCRELANHAPLGNAFDQLQKDKAGVLDTLNKSSKQLDMEESVCEKMRSKYGSDWTQQPSPRLTSTLRSDIKTYRDTVDEAASSDNQLLSAAQQYEADFEAMRSAGDRGETDVLYLDAMRKAGSRTTQKAQDEGNLLDADYSESGPSVADQIAKVEDLLKKLNLVKRERIQVLKDLKEKVHTDDISNMLILNKKVLANHENQLFQAELEKFRSHQNRLISTVHKQSSLLKELTKTYGDLLQDKRVRSDQQKYDSIQKTKSTVLHKYKKVFNAHQDLIQGLLRAQSFYSEMKESVDSMQKNVETFVSNRRAEGAQLLSQIEQTKSNAAGSHAAAEHKRMQELMERLSMDPKATSPSNTHAPALPQKSPPPRSPSLPTQNADPRFTIPPRESPNSSPVDNHPFSQGAAAPISSGYNPMAYPERTITSPISPPVAQPHQPFHFPPAIQQPNLNAFFPQPSHQQPQQPYPQPQPQWQQQAHQQPPQAFSPVQPYNIPQNYIPPPPPPGPPGGGSTTQYPPNTGQPRPSGPGGYAQYQRPTPQSQQQGAHQPGIGAAAPASGADPWAGLSAWK